MGAFVKTMKIFADEGEPIAIVPLVVEPVVVQVRLAVISVQHADIPVVVVVEREGATRSYQKPSGSPPLPFDKLRVGVEFYSGHHRAKLDVARQLSIPSIFNL